MCVFLIFFFRYFTRKAELKKIKEDDGSSDVDDDEFDAYLGNLQIF